MEGADRAPPGLSEGEVTKKGHGLVFYRLAIRGAAYFPPRRQNLSQTLGYYLTFLRPLNNGSPGSPIAGFEPRKFPRIVNDIKRGPPPPLHHQFD
jgi:hypothetical protein